MPLLAEAIIFIIDLYIMAVLLRFFMQYFRTDFYNPFAQSIVKLTNPVLVPLRKLIPGFSGIDMASLVFALLLTIITVILTTQISSFLSTSNILPFLGLMVLRLLSTSIDLFFYLVIGRIILSFVMMGQGGYQSNPIFDLVMQLTQPLMAPFQKIIPPVGMIDFSPIALFFVLRLSQRGLAMLAEPLYRAMM
ncbi:MAG: YggT family protein [Kangiellaceae bacterium]|jgi:YggT family protein|nr:YggT family protein [Kangiellaceae bacterium]